MDLGRQSGCVDIPPHRLQRFNTVTSCPIRARCRRSQEAGPNRSTNFFFVGFGVIFSPFPSRLRVESAEIFSVADREVCFLPSTHFDSHSVSCDIPATTLAADCPRMVSTAHRFRHPQFCVNWGIWKCNGQLAAGASLHSRQRCAFQRHLREYPVLLLEMPTRTLACAPIGWRVISCGPSRHSSCVCSARSAYPIASCSLRFNIAVALLRRINCPKSTL